MDPVIIREYEAKLGDWLAQGYKLLADDVDGELRMTVLWVSPAGDTRGERIQEWWPMNADIVQLLTDNDVLISKALAGPRSWAGQHPEDR